jgi:hypothetical protein
MLRVVRLRPVLLVEHHLELVAAEQVQAVVARVLGELVDLVPQLVELLDQVRAHRGGDAGRRDVGGVVRRVAVRDQEADERVVGADRRGRGSRGGVAHAEAELELLRARALDVELALLVHEGRGDAGLVDLVHHVAQRGVRAGKEAV